MITKTWHAGELLATGEPLENSPTCPPGSSTWISVPLTLRTHLTCPRPGSHFLTSFLFWTSHLSPVSDTASLSDTLPHLPTSSPLRASSFLRPGVLPAPPSHSLNTPGAQEAAGLATSSGRGLKHLAVTEDWPWCIFPQPLQVHLHLQLHSHWASLQMCFYSILFLQAWCRPVSPPRVSSSLTPPWHPPTVPHFDGQHLPRRDCW